MKNYYKTFCGILMSTKFASVALWKIQRKNKSEDGAENGAKDLLYCFAASSACRMCFVRISLSAGNAILGSGGFNLPFLAALDWRWPVNLLPICQGISESKAFPVSTKNKGDILALAIELGQTFVTFSASDNSHRYRWNLKSLYFLLAFQACYYSIMFFYT